MLTVLNSISSLNAENALSATQANLQKTLTQLSTGLRVNSGADDAAGLSIANGLSANIAALTQSNSNAADGIGLLQTADGALAQVTTLLNRAVTLATEASNGNLSNSQSAALNGEYQSILNEIGTIGSTTNFNGQAVFGAGGVGSTATVFTSDGTASGSNTLSTAIAALSVTGLGLDSTQDGTTAGTADLLTVGTPAVPASGNNPAVAGTGAQGALALITAAISTVAANRGAIGAAVNQLSAGQNVQSSEITNLQSASNDIQNADIGKTVANMTQFNVLQQTGMAAMSQSNQAQQSVLKLLQ